VAAADSIYAEMQAAGIDVIIDDRDVRPGVKFSDAELVGIPYRITVGPRGLSDGMVELLRRFDGAVELVPLAEIGAVLATALGSAEAE